MKEKSFPKPLLRWGVFLLIMVSFFGVGGLIQQAWGIYDIDYQDEDWGSGYIYTPSYNASEFNILFDQHSHTLASDGRLTAEQNILWHISQGFNAMVLTDHNNFGNSEEIRNIAREKYNDTIKVFIGMEWTTGRAHFNIILPPNITATQYNQIVAPPKDPTDTEIIAMVDLVHSMDGLVSVNHIPWSERRLHDQPTRQDFFDFGTDFIEVVNSGEYDNESVEFCELNDMGQITGTDMHSPGKTYTWTLLNTTEFTEQAIFDQLVTKNTTVLYEEEGTIYPFSHEENLTVLGTILLPFVIVGEILAYPTIDWWGMVSIIAWLNLIFAGFEIKRAIIKKKKLKTQQ